MIRIDLKCSIRRVLASRGSSSSGQGDITCDGLRRRRVAKFIIAVRMISLISTLAVLSSPFLVGTKAPSVDLDLGFPPSKVNLAERVAGKKVILVGLPGAFTPT